jgi:hypothetical protein
MTWKLGRIHWRMHQMAWKLHRIHWLVMDGPHSDVNPHSKSSLSTDCLCITNKGFSNERLAVIHPIIVARASLLAVGAAFWLLLYSGGIMN